MSSLSSWLRGKSDHNPGNKRFNRIILVALVPLAILSSAGYVLYFTSDDQKTSSNATKTQEPSSTTSTLRTSRAPVRQEAVPPVRQPIQIKGDAACIAATQEAL